MMFERSLREEIHSEIEELRKMELGTDEYKTSVDGVTKLIDRVIEMEKIEVDHEHKAEELKMEESLKLKQMKEERTDRWVKNGIAVATLVASTAVTIWGTIKSFEFEKEGTITTSIGRGFISKLIPKK